MKGGRLTQSLTANHQLVAVLHRMTPWQQISKGKDNKIRLKILDLQQYRDDQRV
jgi:hypothetical protein